MRCTRSLLAVLGLIVGAAGLAPHPASAAPCCSAPLCQRDPPAPICASCDPGCFVGGDTDDGIDYAHDFDSTAGVCHLVAAQ